MANLIHDNVDVRDPHIYVKSKDWITQTLFQMQFAYFHYSNINCATKEEHFADEKSLAQIPSIVN